MLKCPIRRKFERADDPRCPKVKPCPDKLSTVVSCLRIESSRARSVPGKGEGRGSMRQARTAAAVEKQETAPSVLNFERRMESVMMYTAYTLHKLSAGC